MREKYDLCRRKRKLARPMLVVCMVVMAEFHRMVAGADLRTQQAERKRDSHAAPGPMRVSCYSVTSHGHRLQYLSSVWDSGGVRIKDRKAGRPGKRSNERSLVRDSSAGAAAGAENRSGSGRGAVGNPDPTAGYARAGGRCLLQDRLSAPGGQAGPCQPCVSPHRGRQVFGSGDRGSVPPAAAGPGRGKGMQASRVGFRSPPVRGEPRRPWRR